MRQRRNYNKLMRVIIPACFRDPALLALVISMGVFVGVFVGCSKKGNIVPVSGRVTLDGQPLADVAINFGPQSGSLDSAFAAYGKTDAQGRYSLRLVDDKRPGASVGKNRVTLNESLPGGESDGAAPRMAFKLPAKARDGTLEFEVPANGTDAADFEFRNTANKSASK
jgi:hypothetical protein